MATANLSVESKDFTLPVVEATAGADGIVVSTLRNDGWVTLDPGFLTTAQCESKITYIDGKNSILRYRGYPIEQLCEQSDFLEVAWLLRHGELPNKDQYDRFISDINHRTMVGGGLPYVHGLLPAHRASDECDGVRGQRARHVLPGHHGHQRFRPAGRSGDHHHGQGAHHRQLHLPPPSR